MSDAILLLQLDHRKIAKVLDLIQNQVAGILRRTPLNARLLESAFAYLAGYPEKCHHPKEDVVYRRLLSRYPEMADSLRDLSMEHDQLSAQTQELNQSIRELRHAPMAAEDALADRLSTFVDFYRVHMLMEEQHFFPLAIQRLTREDFDEIDFTLFDQPDPLVKGDAEGRFAEIQAEIARLEIEDAARMDEIAEAEGLSKLKDIAAFNESMMRAGEPVLLTRTAGGGYELDCRGDVLTHIPACSESRAAWCAWFYWKARK